MISDSERGSGLVSGQLLLARLLEGVEVPPRGHVPEVVRQCRLDDAGIGARTILSREEVAIVDADIRVSERTRRLFRAVSRFSCQTFDVREGDPFSREVEQVFHKVYHFFYPHEDTGSRADQQ